MSLYAKNLTFKYFKDSPKNIIENLDFSLPVGEITLLAGKSGSGKSTLAYILAGLYPENGGVLTNGQVFFDEINIHELTPDKRVAYVAMMFQNPDLQFCMNTLENELFFCLENIGTPEHEMDAMIEDVVDTLGIHHLLGKNFHHMSGGEKQKCALACILSLKSKCIILDEAFANIDMTSAKEIIGMIKKLNVTVLAIDHNIELWEGVYDNIISLDGSKPKVFDMLPDLHKPGEVVLETKDLAINGIHYPNMQFEQGSLTAIWGRSGCGKTTFLQTMIGQNKFNGDVHLFGKKLTRLRKKQLFSKCGIVFQNPSNQFLSLTVYDEILFSVNRWYQDKNEQWKENKTLELLELFKLERYQQYSPYLLSQGQQRRLAVLSMIAGEQEILLLDEPTYGQDYENICVMMNLLLEKAKSGLTVIFSTHNEHVARNFSHKMIRLREETNE